MTTSDISSFTQQLVESGHLVECGAADKETPLSNTGLTCGNLSPEVSQQFPEVLRDLVDEQPQMAKQYNPFRFTSRCDWLQGTFKYDSLDALRMFQMRMAEIFQDDWGENLGSFTSGIKFDDSVRSKFKIIMAWELPDPENKWKVPLGWLCIPGSAIGRLMTDKNLDNLLFLFDLLDTGRILPHSECKVIREWKATRLDTTIDDFEKRVRPKDLLPIAEKGNYSGFKCNGHLNKITQKWQSPRLVYQQSTKCDPNKDGEVDWAATLHFGSPQSDKSLNIYDKYLESEGKIDSVRWEVRWKDEYAHVRFRRIVECLRNSPEELPFLLASLTTGAIDFIDRHHSTSKRAATRVAECPRYAFWQEFLDCLGCTRIPISAPEITVEKVVNWINYQVATPLFSLSKICGMDELMEAIERIRDNAEPRVKRRHQNFIQQGIADKFDIHKHLDIQFAKYRKSTDSEFYATG